MKSSYYVEHRETILLRAKEHYINNKEKRLEYVREYQRNNKEKKRIWAKKYRDNNKDKRRKWIEANREKIAKSLSNRAKARRLIDANYRLSTNLRSRLYKAIRGYSKDVSAVKDLDCSIEQLKKHIESQFREGMTWDNYGTRGWHIDHILPLSSFNLSDTHQAKKACHYTNLQPLWWYENLKKRHDIT